MKRTRVLSAAILATATSITSAQNPTPAPVIPALDPTNPPTFASCSFTASDDPNAACSASGQFCNLPLGTCLNKSALWQGTCKTTPTGTDCFAATFLEVCGCDDTTYDSECAANFNGVSVAYAGACSTEPPTPGPTAVVVTPGPTTAEPTAEPTVGPSPGPTASPSEGPTTRQPTVSPTEGPTTETPTETPTGDPTEGPTGGPTLGPSPSPVTEDPTMEPTEKPTTPSPTATPTDQPSSSDPTLSPSKNPTTEAPTGSPATEPTTEIPTVSPSKGPTNFPTLEPSSEPTDDPTGSPTESPTPSPSESPTLLPSGSPTPFPSRNPTPGSASPSTPPTPGPTTSPTTEPTKNPTTSPTTSTPTTSPTKEPTQSPMEGTLSPTTSQSPTNNPSKAPTTSPTTAMPTLRNETASPTLAPITEAPTASPTSEPTKSPVTSPPTRALEGPTETAGLTITLNGISGIPNRREWERTTAEFYENVYADGEEIEDAKVSVEITNEQPKNGRRARNLMNGNGVRMRGLQATDSSVEVTYTQTTTYRSNDPNLTINEIVLIPLSTPTDRDLYVGELKNLDGYEQLTEVSEITVATDSPDKGTGGDNEAEDKGGLGAGAIAGIACGCAAFVILVGGFVYYRVKNKDNDDSDPNNASTILSSTQDERTNTNTGTGSSLPTYGDQSVATVDYDYSKAYGGAGNHSLSDAGGTLGSRTRQTAAEDLGSGTGPPGDPSMLPPGSGNTIFSDDPTFDQAYEDVREELLDIYAPAGKLGVVIDTPDDGAPVVHAVKDTSPICDKVQVGDKLVAVDDEDVRAMTAIKVSKLISRKSNNASRKLTIIRHVANS
eukprot:CAMPEP_0183717330 /NCGR_PEP_ID=MMETSP0737-20130205/10974_1 /TAXON_ID=385413 /ORGANISM="Thalassiosira miniscula, Strain CCMP1093" /LENGTH=832 /DNA_ID=CAMNT_0025946747 /DNA_START=388 /DNA_END=2886 /DNA_ORIENTATION=+